MPRFGALHLSDWQDRFPEVDGYGTQPLLLPGARVLNLASEIASVEADPLVPRAMNPSIPPYVLCTIGVYPQTPFGPFKIAELRIVARAAYRPRAFVLRCFIDNAQAAGELSRRWGYPAAAGVIEMRERHDRIEATVLDDGRPIFHGEMLHREIVAGLDLQFISSMHVVRNRDDGKVVLMQVDPEYAVTRAERGDSRITAVDPQAWHTGGCLVLTNPMTATIACADVTLPRIRFICDPERPAYEGTIRWARLPKGHNRNSQIEYISMARDNSLIPEQFGPLQGLRIVSTGFYLAQPFAASLAAEMGAEVIHIERPKVGDPYRMWRADGTHGYGFMQERRNMLCVTLDFSKSRGRGLFLKLLGESDIWMESSKPGSLAKFGLDDDTVLKAHPRLVITHVSGFGQSGDPEYVSRPAYDSIGQAFSGMMYQNGDVDRSPYRAQPDTGDYMTASYALWSSLAAYIRMLKSGKGQSIDVAIFEVVHKHLGPTMLEFFQEGIVRERHGNKSTFNQPMDCFRAKDGWVMIVAMFAQFDRLCELMGMDPKDWRPIHLGDMNTAQALEFDAALRKWVADQPVDDLVRLLIDNGVPCAKVLSSKDVAEHPHYKARQMHMEWEDGLSGRVKGIGVTPKFSETPGKIWRGAVGLGHDNALVYGKLLGLPASELEQLQREEVV